MSDKIKVGGIFQRQKLCMIQVIGIDNSPGAAAQVFKIFSNNGMSLEFISQSETTEGWGTITLCTSAKHCPVMDKVEVEVRSFIKPKVIKRNPSVEMITLYGPHFAERHSIAQTICSALGEGGINIVGISTSVNSITCVISTQDSYKALQVIQQTFEFPEY